MPLDIEPTGVPGLDTVLRGGLPRGTLLLLVGPPGTGKTILSQQLCFSWINSAGAEDEEPRRAIYFSTLSEPHSKLITHVETFSFFDPSELGKCIEILSLQEFMAQGLDATATAIVQQVRHSGASLVVVDGFRALEALSDNSREIRGFLYKLSTQLSMLGATTIITVERGVRDPEAYGEFTTADAVIGLHNTLVNVQHRRRVEVMKLRGVHHLPGLHSYRITNNGWQVFPRLESLIQFNAAPAQHKYGRFVFDLPELDAVVGGGLPAGSSTLLAGSTGVGKTLLSLHYLAAGLQRGEPSLYLGFHEDYQQLLDKAGDFGISIQPHIDSGLLTIHTLPAVELEIDEFTNLLRTEVEGKGIKRLVIDSVLSLDRAAGKENRADDYAAALHTYLRRQGVTTIFTKELLSLDGAQLQTAESPMSVVCENLIVMRYAAHEDSFYRVLTVMKMRSSDHDRSIREFTIEPGRGVRILDSDESDLDTMTDIARQLRETGDENTGSASSGVSNSKLRGRRQRAKRSETTTEAQDG